MKELAKTYSAKEVEAKWYAFWEARGFFKPENQPKSKPAKSSAKSSKKLAASKTPFVIVIPPPNVTGILHMGHGLNNTIQDILIRWHRMKEVPTLWVPGTDHAGIATQNVVEKKLAAQGKHRHDLGRGAFVEEVWKWKEQYGSTIVGQLRKLGASCDWSRERFTMDEGLSRAVREVFVKLYKDDLIYQGHYLINWCPRCATALSDEEVEHEEIEGALYSLKYPVKDSAEFVIVATTRPETMLGDTAVAINPKDERYQRLRGKTLMLPLVDREIPIIEDAFVDPAFGTGCVKVTPAHDPNDFDMGKRHGLAEINVLTEYGLINDNGGVYKGLDRFAAREKIISDLEAAGLFAGKKAHLHSVGHCYRCHTVIEPYYSKQWFVRMKPLAKEAIAAAKNKEIRFYPERWTKVYLNWMTNIRDWCISRQIWWGHRIPVWYDDEGTPYAAHSEAEARKMAHKKRGQDVSLTQDPDVLDTWFSSWLWPFSTLGWPEKTKDLKTFYPTTTLVTGPDILFFWVARMIMAGLYCMKELPFTHVYLHGTVRDETGRKMSKSLGNIIDPLEIIEEIGADALRFVVISLVSQGQDVYLSKQRFEGGRNFTNKIWNAARFAFMNLEGFAQGSEIAADLPETLSAVNQWILIELDQTVIKMDRALVQYRFSDAAQALQRFIWGEFCDWYLELQKPTFYGDRGGEEKAQSQKVLFFVMDKMLRLLHPIMPFITEEIWQILKDYSSKTLPETLMHAAWPEPAKISKRTSIQKQVQVLKELVSALRDKLAAFDKAKTSVEIHVVLKPGKAAFIKSLIKNFQSDICRLGRVASVRLEENFEKSAGWLLLDVPAALHEFEAYVEIGRLVDPSAEREKLAAELNRLEVFEASLVQKLENANFVARAPQEVVEKERQKLEDARIKLARIRAEMKELS